MRTKSPRDLAQGEGRQLRTCEDTRLMSLPRYCPEAPLPTSAYVPGKSALVERPSFSDFAIAPELFASQGFRLGADLFNAQFYWEAHEVWESLWAQLGAADSRRLVLQALIQAAASYLKRAVGHSAGAMSLLAKSLQKLTKLEERGECPEFLRALRAQLQDAAALPVLVLECGA